MARTNDERLPGRVRELVAPVADEFDAIVLDVQVKGQTGSRMVRVVVDHADLDPEAALDIDAIAELSRRCGDELERRDVIPGAYTLEVTSPGADRPLTTARDFARNLGREVRVHRAEGREGPPELRGLVVAVTDDDVTLETGGEPTRIPLADLDHGKVVLPW